MPQTQPNNSEDDLSYQAAMVPESRATVKWVHGTSRVTTCLSVPPLKILNPRNISHASMLYLSSYGGGMLQGDQVRLRLECGKNAALFLGSQANGRVFKHEQEGDARQVIHGSVASGGFAVVLPQPVVLHTASRFVQFQEWQIAQGASLVLADWIQSGRSDSGEQFAYQAWSSETRLMCGDKLVCVDRFRSDPAIDFPAAPPRFGGLNLMLNIYVIGPVRTYLANILETLVSISEISKLLELDQKSSPLYPRTSVSLAKVDEDDLSVLRCLAQTREELDHLLEALCSALEDPAWLGFNPMSRRP